MGCKCPHQRGWGGRKRRIIAGVGVGEARAASGGEGMSSYRALMNALWHRNVQRACRVPEEIRTECSGNVSVGQVA